MHGSQSGTCATMLVEGYGNSITLGGGTGSLTQRGGHGLFLFNKQSSTAGSWFQYSGLWANDCSTLNPETVRPRTYNINNRANTTLINMFISSDTGGIGLAEDVSYWNTKSSCTATACSSGVGCGSATPTGTCTAGMGYFKTDLSCSSVDAANVGISPSSPISGTFYKCTSANTWTPQWTPYTYPHPLRLADSGDTTPPTISLTSPTSGSTVSGSSVTVSANANDNVAVAGVQFKLDGANLGSEVTASPYSVSWNTTQTANGSHTLTALARDAAGNQTTSSAVTVTVNNDIIPPAAPTGVAVI